MRIQNHEANVGKSSRAGRFFALWAGAFGLFACSTTQVIPNTKVADTAENREIIEVCERYRHAMELRDSAMLIALASPRYYEDSGTPKAEDDYGYDGLKQVITDRLSRLRSIRYEMEYRNVHIKEHRAEVEVYIDASFQIATEGGADQFKHVTEYNKFELENDGKRWLFTSGM